MDCVLHMPVETIYGLSEGFIYFIAVDDVEPRRVKIGFTKSDPHKRMKLLQTGCPFRMRMLGFCPGTFAAEQELHDVLRDDRCCGEWFVLSDYASTIINDQLGFDHG